MLGAARAGGELVELVAAERRVPARAVARGRVMFVDASRGAAVLAMLVANLVNVCLRDVPNALSHNQGDVLRTFDLPAPVFQLLVGVSLPLFLAQRRRAGRGETDARRDAVRRFVLLVLLGMVLDGVGKLSLVPRWGVLQTLGLGGLVATAVVDAPPAARAVLSVFLLCLYSGFANGEVHGRPDAALAFVPLTLAGTVLGDVIATGTAAEDVARLGVRLAAVAGAVGLALDAAGIPFNKVVGTSSFVALAIAVGAGVLAAVAWWESRGGRCAPWLLLLGRNALTAWVLLHVVIYYPAWIVFPSWGRLPLASGLAAVAMTTAALAAGTGALARRGIRVPL
jgi:predicted acyltransferase